MSSPFSNVLPVLRAPSVALRYPSTYHVAIPGDRAGATPWAAFTAGQDLLTRAEVKSAGVSGDELLETAIANLTKRPAKWTVEASTGGFLGIGRSPCVLSFTDPFAAEQLLIEEFLKAAQHRLSPRIVIDSRIAYFAPKRGQIRAVLAEGNDASETPFVVRERELARATWDAAGDEAVCSAQLHPSSTFGNPFAVGELFAGTPGPYCPPFDSVRLMVMHSRTLGYVKNGSTAPKRKLMGELSLLLGVRDISGQATPLAEGTLSQLGLSFETSLDPMIAAIPALPVIDMGMLRSGRPLMGFRGNGAIDQLASVGSLKRLHAMLGDPFVVHIYSDSRVSATTADIPRAGVTIVQMVELCDPVPPNTFMTRGTLDYDLYTVSGGAITGVSRAEL